MKTFTFLADYTPEESPLLLKAFDSFAFNHDGRVLTRYLRNSRELMLADEDEMAIWDKIGNIIGKHVVNW
ncbi:MAG: hypothetical protein ACOCXT_02890 [Candidatus Dojkabacteria bacterium]